MTTINIVKASGFVKSIEVKGHTGYEVAGKDIVCAAISSSSITTVNAILSLEQDTISVKEENGYLQINTLKNTDITNKLLLNLIDMLKDIETEYPKYLKINIGGE